MSDPRDVEREIREYLEIEPNLRREDRLNYLKALFNKHLEVRKLDHMVNSSDLFEIFSGAKAFYTNKRMPVRVTKKQLDSNEAAHISVIESFISYLNRLHLLKKVVKFDYTD